MVRRRRQTVDHLVRVVVRDGALRVATAEHRSGRSAWVTAEREAVATLEAQPQRAWRTLRVRGVPAGPLVEDARGQAIAALEPLLRRAWRSGLLRAPSPRCAGAIATLHARGSGIRPAGPGSVFEVSPEALRAVLGPHAPPQLVLLPGHPARRLAAMLRRLERLG